MFASSIILLCAVIALLVTASRSRTRFDLLIASNARSEAQISLLNDYINKIEQENTDKKSHCARLQEELHHAKTELELKSQEQKEFSRRIEDWEKSRQEAVNHAKAAIFETASELSRNLIKAHKAESKESEEKIAATTTKLHEQFSNIVSNLAVLTSEVKSSQHTVDQVKNALLSPAGAGSLAEITLENILKASGLEPERDFIMQYSFSLKSEEKRLRPDAVVFLPDNNIMIIDSKASKYFTEITEEFQDKLKLTMRNHLRSLSSKDYHESLREFLHHKKINHISSIMFLPTEASIEKLSKADKDFMSAAWEKDILPVGPAGLVNILTHTKFQIAVKKQSQNQLAIIEEVKKLLHSLLNLYDHARKVGDSLYNASTHFDKFAGSFNTNLLPKARKLEKLGVHLQKNKAIPAAMDRFTVLVSGKNELVEVEVSQVEDTTTVE